MEETISLKELFQTLKKRLVMIVLISVLAALASGIVSYFFITPIYQSSVQILVNQSKNANQLYNFNELQTNVSLVNTYSVIIKNPAIIDQVKNELHLDMTNKELTSKISVTSEKDTQVFNVIVEDISPYRAEEIAKTIGAVFQKEVKTLMNVDNVKVLKMDNLADQSAPIKPKKAMNVAIAFVVGLMAAVGLAFLLEYLDNTIKTEADIEKFMELPILGAVTEITQEKEAKTKKVKAISRTRGETLGS